MTERDRPSGRERNAIGRNVGGDGVTGQRESSRRTSDRDQRRGRSHQRPTDRAKRTDAARMAAWRIVEAVRVDDAYANIVAPRILAAAGLQGRDAGFATELAYGTLRMQGAYDAIIDHHLDGPGIDAPLRDVLRLGCHQGLAMRVPTHAAVSESVALARSQVGVGAAGLVNAVLRRICAQDFDSWMDQLTADMDDEIQRLATRYSHPAWVVRSLRQSLVWHGRDAGDLPDLLASHNTPALVTLVARPGLVDPAELEGTSEGSWVATARVLSGGDPGRFRAVREHRAGVQDEGSQVVTQLAVSVPLEGSDETWLDLCAGPGGKAALLAALLGQRPAGGRLVANEVTAHRAELVRQSVSAAPVPVEVVVGDGRQMQGEFDRVIVDAPCTGLGALRRRPEARWRRQPSDLPGLGALQRDLLQRALEVTRPGGVVAYITCSPHLSETALVVEDALRRSPGVEVIDVRDYLKDVMVDFPPVGSSPYLQMWTDIHHSDGMFLALLRVGSTPT